MVFVALTGCDDRPHGSLHDLSAQADLSAPPTATVLASTNTLTNCLALDSSSLYYTEASDVGSTSRLMKLAKSGGMPQLLIDGIDSPGCAVIDDANAYVTRNGEILKVPLGGGSPASLALGQHLLPGSSPHLSTLNGYLYWITDVYGQVDAYNGMNALVRLSTSGGSIDVLFNDLVGSPGGLAVDASNVYYSDSTGMYVRPLGGGPAGPIGQSTLHNNRFAIDDMNLVLVEVMGVSLGDVALFKLDGSGGTLLYSKLVSALAIDPSGVYANAEGQLTRFWLEGQPPTTMSQILDPSAPRAIALDATDVYFTDGASILRYSK
jgi:hypothetical protein